MPEPKPMAHRALETMDAKGELSMLDYLAAHQDEAPYDEQPQLGCIILQDHSAVIVSKNTYTFAWSENRNATTATRRRDPHRSPEPPAPAPRPTYMYTWPTDSSVLQRTLLSRQYCLYHQMRDAPSQFDPDQEESLIGTGEAYRLFPDLLKLTKQALAEGRNEAMFTEQEHYESAAASELETLIPRSQWKRIDRMLSERILRAQPQEETE